VLGEAPGSLSAEAKARLGYAPQEVRLYPWMTARQVIAYTAAFYPFWDQPWVDELTERWQLPLNRRVGTLSTGQVQKLALVLALGHRPELLVLDEPVSSLDPLARREFVKSLVAMTNDGEHTVLFSTHITSDVERVATHVAVLRDGRIACYDELDAIKDRVKRLRLRAAQDLPSDFAVHGALRTKVEGRQALVAVADVDPDMLDALRDRWQADVAVEDLNLEEIFLEMHDG
jgi:ABC-2 type transport system ATP-binding protein